MAETFTRVIRYGPDGSVLEDYTVPKPAEQVNEETIRERAEAALADNLAYLGTQNPSNAEAAAQIKALTRQVNGVIRLLLNRFDSSD